MPQPPHVPYPGSMGQPDHATTDDLLAGMNITEEGKARARRLLDEAHKRMDDPQVRAKMQAQIGRPPTGRAA